MQSEVIRANNAEGSLCLRACGLGPVAPQPDQRGLHLLIAVGLQL